MEPFVSYALIDPDCPSNQFVVNGNDYLAFNDGTSATFHDTYTIVQKTRGASKCYLASSGVWYQLMLSHTMVRQYSHNGATTRSVVRKPHPSALSEVEIRTLMKVSVHSSTESCDGEYMLWQSRLFDTLESGQTNVDDIKRALSHVTASGDVPYLGGRWLAAHLASFAAAHPKYDDLLDLVRVDLNPTPSE